MNAKHWIIAAFLLSWTTGALIYCWLFGELP